MWTSKPEHPWDALAYSTLRHKQPVRARRYKTGQTPVRSLPQKENGKARTSMDEKSVRKSHGHHIPPAKGMGERALLLLGLLSLLTAADEVRHADAQHRATSNPSEGHTVKTGEREAGALLVLDGKGNGAAFEARIFNKF